jgi:hypothetical protein
VNGVLDLLAQQLRSTEIQAGWADNWSLALADLF